jgi:hypothetical protein
MKNRGFILYLVTTGAIIVFGICMYIGEQFNLQNKPVSLSQHDISHYVDSVSVSQTIVHSGTKIISTYVSNSGYQIDLMYNGNIDPAWIENEKAIVIVILKHKKK